MPFEKSSKRDLKSANMGNSNQSMSYFRPPNISTLEGIRMGFSGLKPQSPQVYHIDNNEVRRGIIDYLYNDYSPIPEKIAADDDVYSITSSESDFEDSFDDYINSRVSGFINECITGESPIMTNNSSVQSNRGTNRAVIVNTGNNHVSDNITFNYQLPNGGSVQLRIPKNQKYLETLPDNQLSTDVFDHYMRVLFQNHRALVRVPYLIKLMQGHLHTKGKLEHPTVQDIQEYINRSWIGCDIASLNQNIDIIKQFFKWTSSTKKPNGECIYPDILADYTFPNKKQVSMGFFQMRTFRNIIRDTDVKRYFDMVDSMPGYFDEYKEHLTNLMNYLKSVNKFEHPQIEDILNYARLNLVNNNPSTIAQFTQAVRTFFEWTNVTRVNDVYVYPNIAFGLNTAKIKNEIDKEKSKNNPAEYVGSLTAQDYDRYISILKDDRVTTEQRSGVLQAFKEFIAKKGKLEHPETGDLYSFAQEIWPNIKTKGLTRNFFPIRSFFEWTATTKAANGKFIYPNITLGVVATQLLNGPQMVNKKKNNKK